MFFARKRKEPDRYAATIPPGYSNYRTRSMIDLRRDGVTLAAGRTAHYNAALATACCAYFGPTYHTERVPAYYTAGYLDFAGGIPIP